MYEIVKRHGETYIYKGQTCIAIATEAGEKAVEELVRESNLGNKHERAVLALQDLLNSGFESQGQWYSHPRDMEKVNTLRALAAESAS